MVGFRPLNMDIIRLRYSFTGASYRRRQGPDQAPCTQRLSFSAVTLAYAHICAVAIALTKASWRRLSSCQSLWQRVAAVLHATAWPFVTLSHQCDVVCGQTKSGAVRRQFKIDLGQNSGAVQQRTWKRAFCFDPENGDTVHPTRQRAVNFLRAIKQVCR